MIRPSLIALALWSFFSAVAHAAPTIGDAEDLYFQAKVGEAEQAFRQIIGSTDASPADKASAGRGLARIAWRIDGNGAAALEFLDQARARGADLCTTARDEVRILREMGRPAAAVEFDKSRGTDCPDTSQADTLHLQAAMAELDVAASTQGASRSAALAQAKAMLASLSPDRRFSGAAEHAHLESALLDSDPHAALDAWRGYYWLTDRDAPPGMTIPAGDVAATFNAALCPKAALNSQINLLRLLLRGGFYEEAQRFDAAVLVGARAAGDPRYVPVVAYYQYRRELDPTVLQFNRKTARGQGDPAAFTAKIKSLIATLAQTIQPGASDPAPILKQTYGLYWALGETSGFASLHQGHIVEDGRIPVIQFNRKLDLGFVSLDNMIANGFQTWLWDGMAETGGWTTDDGVIVQVRSAYTPPVLKGLISLSSDMRLRNAKKLSEREAIDLETLRTKQVAYLPGLQQRLDEKSVDQIAAAAHSEAARLHKPFALSFVKLYWHAMIQHSIAIHEGRHALDKAQYGQSVLNDPELEYRAKLSELELADYPKMAMSNIMAPNIGDGSPHGDANARIYAGLVDWMTNNQDKIAGFYPNTPALEQADRMSDEQIRSIARGLDPQFRK